MTRPFFHKIRIAPTPSGYLHIGNAASFLLTASLAKQAGAKLLLRIDDMDKERVRKDYVEDIFETLRFLEIEWHEGAKNYEDYKEQYSQHQRLHLYKAALEQLKKEEKVFACACSRKELSVGQCHCFNKNISLDEQNVSWRLITDHHQLMTVKTMNENLITGTLPLSMQSFMVRKKDGLPAYQLTSLIDDEHFGIDAIVRGKDLWESTLAQQYLAHVLDKSFFREVLFYHHPLVADDNGKLSKSAGSASVRHLIRQGKSREEIIEMIRHTMKDDMAKEILAAVF